MYTFRFILLAIQTIHIQSYQTEPTSILNLVSGDAAKAVYIWNCQVKTCAIGPDLELHNSKYIYSNAPLFIQPESLS